LLFDDFLPARDPALPGDVVLNLSHGVVGYDKAFVQADRRGAMVEGAFWLGDASHPATLFLGDAHPAGGAGGGWGIRASHAGLE
jgi:hypothetical protein